MTKQIKLIERILQNRVLLHCLFWFSTLIIFGLYGMGIGMPFLAGVIIKFFFLPVQILATYFLIYYQIPNLLFPKKYLLFAISFFLSVLVFCTLAHLSEDFGLAKIVIGYTPVIHTFWEIISDPFGNVWYSAEEIYPTVFIVAVMKFIKQQFEETTKLDFLEQEKANAEIKLLKAQINPRILSKTLYQLHALTLEKSDAAPEVVIKLSEMLDYMLYQCNSPKVLVSDEITLIQNYLDLEKLRHGEAINITFFHHLNNQKLEITPLLLLSLIEAVFIKKGEKLPPDAKVEIILQEKNENLSLQIISNLVAQQTVPTIDAQKQLELLYPKQHELASTTKDGVFNLSLNLSP